jgi:hypothetical protein
MSERKQSPEEFALDVEAGEIVPVDGGFLCRGCGTSTHKLFRGEKARTARCIRCLAGLSPRQTRDEPAQIGLGL